MIDIMSDFIIFLGFKTNGYMSKQIAQQNKFSPSGQTKYCFLFGDFLKISPSPELHTKWFLEKKKDIVYLPYEVESKFHLIKSIRALLNCKNFIGGNITKPFKSSLLMEKNFILTEDVFKTRSANTIYKNENNEWVLENTDIHGISVSLKKLMPLNKKFNLVIFGGGGASSSAIYTIINQFKFEKIICVSRSPNKTKEQFRKIKKPKDLLLLNYIEFNETEHEIKSSKINLPLLIINSVPEQKANDIHTKSVEKFLKSQQPDNTYFFDMIYKETRLMKQAHSLGIKSINGEIMLIEQAKVSFSFWMKSKI
jgi:shikimate dehydrogenase